MDACVQALLQQIQQSPTCYHVAETVRQRLIKEGYQELHEAERWGSMIAGRYFVVRNDSSVIAFRICAGAKEGFALTASHGDSPTFKLKEHAEKKSGYYVQLHTEKYGGMLMASWFDRPLGVAGRIFLRREGEIVSQLVDLNRDLLVIPSVAIHMNRNANEGTRYQANIDTLPLYGGADSVDILALIAEKCGVAQQDILGSDLYLYCRGQGTCVGAAEEFILSPKLDDLGCAFGCLEGFLTSQECNSIPLCCIFDNEEVGSGTKQGAASTFLRDTLRRITFACGGDEETYQMMLARSFMVSADNAHAIHPNHPEYADTDNSPVLNRGVVVKFNANQRYTTDGYSAARMRSICTDAGVPVQVFANRSDLPGGSTLGSIANTQVPVRTVDIGLPQLAMHAAWETAGARDYGYLIRAMRQFYQEKM